MRFALVHYHELALKGRNRGYFEQRLVQHLRSVLRGTGITRVEALPGRILITPNGDTSWCTIQERLKHTLGVANFSQAHRVPFDRSSPDLTHLCQAIREAITPLSFSTFKVTTKRSEKRFSKSSLDINREVGAYLCEQTGKPVNLGNPDLNIIIEVLNGESYFSLCKKPGPGGDYRWESAGKSCH